jgi:hypothetical protein
MRRSFPYLGVVLVAGIYGCGGKSPAGSGGGAGADLDASDPDALIGAVTCAPATYPIDSYAAGMIRVGENHLVTFQLVQSDLAPPQLGTNTWTLKIAKDNAQMPMGDIVAHASMPLHAHPASLQPIVTFDSASGTYTATPVYLFMVGYWKVEFTVYDGPQDANSTPIDVGAFNFCVD